MSDREIRTFLFDIEERAEDSPKITGHAAVFDEIADIGGFFREKIAKGAFKQSIKDDDVRALFNHDPNFVLGRNTAGTLELKEDDKGLAIRIDPPQTQFANDLMTLMKRGDISQMSFAFQVMGEEWEENKGELPLRTLRKLRLFDVSPVTYPAYEGTDVAVRARDAWRKEKRFASDVQTATKNLNDAIKLHQRHMDGSVPTNDESQMEMMDMMMSAMSALDDEMAGKMQRSKPAHRISLTRHLLTLKKRRLT